MAPRSALFLPPKTLSSCIAAVIVRDTRGAGLPARDRFNVFPATPLVSVTQVFKGELRLTDTAFSVTDAANAQALPSAFVVTPQNKPTVSWSTGDVFAVTVGFFPDAWLKLGANLNENSMPTKIKKALQVFESNKKQKECWVSFCDILHLVWQENRRSNGLADWPGSDRLSDWAMFLMNRLATTKPGQSARTMERRLRRWTGRSRQQLDHIVAVEDLHRRSVKTPSYQWRVWQLMRGFRISHIWGALCVARRGFRQQNSTGSSKQRNHSGAIGCWESGSELLSTWLVSVYQVRNLIGIQFQLDQRPVYAQRFRNR